MDCRIRMSTQHSPIPLIASIADLAATTDAWLVDIWGVMHNGVAPFAPAVEACRRFRAAGGSVLLLSNAPRPWASVATQLDRIGVAREAWDGIVSSGDAARGLIADLGEAPVLHIGPERDVALFEGLAARRVAEADARSVVCTGLYDDETETPDSYAALLGRLHARRLGMICANPDLKVERGHRVIYCAGAVAAAFEALGGAVAYAGKPHLPIYDRAFATLAGLRGASVPRDRVLAIGDGVSTDIKGAHAAGVRSVYVSSAVNLGQGRGLDAGTLSELFDSRTERPVAAMTGLAW